MPQPDHIVRIPLPDQDALEDDILKYFAKCEEKLGLVPYVLRAYTKNPAKFRNFVTFYNQLMLDEETCGLTKLEREMIAVTVSAANRCYYCLVAHGQAATFRRPTSRRDDRHELPRGGAETTPTDDARLCLETDGDTPRR